MKKLTLTLILIGIAVIGILTFAVQIIEVILGLAGIGILAIIALIIWATWKVKSTIE